MIVKELIEQCPVSALASKFLSLCDMDDNCGRAVSNFKLFIEQLKYLDPIFTGYMIVGTELTEDGRKYLDADLYKECDLHEFLENNKLAETGTVRTDILTDEETEEMLSQLELPEVYAFEFSPWQEILGYKLAPGNVRDVGDAALAAAILYEMTFFGFSEGETEKKRRELDEAIQEAEEIRKLPPEEQEKHYIPAEELFRDLGWEDERTEQEKAAERSAMMREALENRLSRIAALKKLHI